MTRTYHGSATSPHARKPQASRGSNSRRHSRFQAKYAATASPGSASPIGPLLSTASPLATAVGMIHPRLPFSWPIQNR